MSAASPKVETARDASGQEPSMEDILASIRRIIADDQAGEPPPPASATPPAPRAGNDDVLDLAEVARPVRRPQPVPFEPSPLDFDDTVDFAEPAPPPPPRPAPQEALQEAPQRIQAAIEDQVVERLVSKTTDASVGQAFQLLSHTVLTSNARTLEDLVKDMLRPMLKAWLDENLPMMVERLVRVEIERVARGR